MPAHRISPFPLTDKIIAITGGGSGICLSFVQVALRKFGTTKILICDLQLTPEAQSTLDAHPHRVAFTRCDVSLWSDLERIPSAIKESFGTDAVADVWIAGAGVFEPRWSSWLYDSDSSEGGREGYKQFAINAEHPLKLTRIAMRSLLGADKPGVVLLLASLAGTGGQYAAPLYCASKHAVVGFTKSMMQAEADEGVRVGCICPGMVRTPLWTGEQGKEQRKQFMYTDDACVSSEEVAEAMVEMVEDTEGKYPGGSLLEVSKKNLRGMLESRQGIVDDGSEAMKKWIDHCYEPIREVFKNERADGQSAKGV